MDDLLPFAPRDHQHQQEEGGGDKLQHVGRQARVDGNLNAEMTKNTTIESEIVSTEVSQSFDDTTLTDGVYEGKAYGYDGAVKATVTIKDGKITDISCSSAESDLWYFDKCKDKVVSEILEAQNTNVDAVSGATYSSNGIKKAVLDALKQAGFPAN